ncbi:extracellular solute-binding protein [Notoacmeibacter sp. MSK16QG-6]|uniref:extracellular solute-binding protein n=1 Tax=Notoacmeibacter sp. MSK16QG-6 TaxID=2957982 RepID=UPI0020A0CBC5|nr:extracellular solute-binding protein [Notoacmeibacter sp. MSK16QG-6]MCP1200461.1 extracellular solute-binding protein [Notoacmeibacter sp. MSK16QG-6]
MLKTPKITVLAALLLGTTLSGAQAASGEVQMVLKDFLSTNENQATYVENIEKALAEKGHDIDIKVVDLPSGSYADALGVMLLSGDIPDLIYFQGGDEKIAAQGVLEDWRPWIEKTEYLKDALYPHNKARLENYPYLLFVYPLRGWQPVMRSDWLEKVGTDVPKSLEEFKALLEAIRDGDLDGNGQKDTYGFTAGGNLGELDGFLNPAFGIDATWLKDENGKWVHAQISDQEREKLMFYHELFEEGLLDPEYVTINWEAKEDKFYTGRAGVVSASRAGNVVVYETKMNTIYPDTGLTLLDPPSGPGGQGLQAVDVSREGRGWAMSALSENKEAVVALLDFMASPEGQMMERLGLPDIHHKGSGENIEVLPALGSWESPFMVAANWESPVKLLPEAAEKYLQNMQEYFIPDNQFAFPADFAAALDATDNDYNAWAYRFVSGEVSFDRWDEYVEAWKADGGSILLEYAEQQLQ